MIKENSLNVAKETNDINILSQLANSIEPNIRRAVARNKNTSSKTISRLINDPVMNVSYMASLHPNCKEQKDFKDISHPCIQCEEDERNLVCTNCTNLNSYYNNIT